MSLGPDSLNADCTCISLDRAALNRALEAEVGDPAFCPQLAITHPTLISNVPVFLRNEHAARMAEIILAIETIATLEPYREAALQSAAAISQFNPGPVGVFMGYDFHLGADGPKLIEINTNAGGALINAFVARAQKACCTAVGNLFPRQFSDHAADATFMEDFFNEWRRQRGDQPLAMIAIVDRDPEARAGECPRPRVALLPRHTGDRHRPRAGRPSPRGRRDDHAGDEQSQRRYVHPLAWHPGAPGDGWSARDQLPRHPALSRRLRQPHADLRRDLPLHRPRTGRRQPDHQPNYLHRPARRSD